MNGLCCPAPAPCASTSAALARPATAWYTRAVTVPPDASGTVSSVGLCTGVVHFGISLQLARHGKRAELIRQRSRQHPVDVAANHARERHVSPLHDDVNRRVP